MEISKEYLKELKMFHDTAIEMGIDVSFYDTVSGIISSYDELNVDMSCGYENMEAGGCLNDSEPEVLMSHQEVTERLAVLTGLLSVLRKHIYSNKESEQAYLNVLSEIVLLTEQ
jgi:hypothetical protein